MRQNPTPARYTFYNPWSITGDSIAMPLSVSPYTIHYNVISIMCRFNTPISTIFLSANKHSLLGTYKNIDFPRLCHILPVIYIFELRIHLTVCNVKAMYLKVYFWDRSHEKQASLISTTIPDIHNYFISITNIEVVWLIGTAKASSVS